MKGMVYMRHTCDKCGRTAELYHDIKQSSPGRFIYRGVCKCGEAYTATQDIKTTVLRAKKSS